MFANVGRLAVVGVAKNSGKTTTMNTIAADQRAVGRCVGIFSIGVDGERQDVLIGTPKPPVHLVAGDLVVTASQYIESSSASFEFVHDMGIRTPVGDAMLVRCLTDGEVVLAGLRHRSDFESAARALESEGADLVLIDGAYGRLVGARIADGVVISTGAVVASTAIEVAERTGALIASFELPEVETPWQQRLLEKAIADDRIYLGGSSIEPRSLGADSALIALSAEGEAWDESVEAVAIPGLVSDGVVERLLVLKPRILLVPDPTVLQVATAVMARLQRSWEIRVGRSPRLLAISVNPTAPRTPRIESENMASALIDKWPHIHVFDAHRGLEALP